MESSLTGLRHMVDPRGGVHEVKIWEIDTMRQRGWRIVVNPKNRYLPEFDLESKLYINLDPMEMEEDVFLKGEII